MIPKEEKQKLYITVTKVSNGWIIETEGRESSGKVKFSNTNVALTEREVSECLGKMTTVKQNSEKEVPIFPEFNTVKEEMNAFEENLKNRDKQINLLLLAYTRKFKGAKNHKIKFDDYERCTGELVDENGRILYVFTGFGQLKNHLQVLMNAFSGKAYYDSYTGTYKDK